MSYMQVCKISGSNYNLIQTNRINEQISYNFLCLGFANIWYKSIINKLIQSPYSHFSHLYLSNIVL